MDVIAKCAFGTDVDDVDDDSDEFVENAWGASQSKVNKSPWILLARKFPLNEGSTFLLRRP